MSNFIDPTTVNPLISFDPNELRSKIIDRLNQSDVFTDQNYLGSNLSAIIDIISYAFGSLQYYNSKSSSESMFSETQVYENMNKIVKALNYKPLGKMGQTVPITLSASSDLPTGTYVIPRFSYVQVGGTVFSLSQDLSFSKLTNEAETVINEDYSTLLHQGTFEEYPVHDALGIEDEVVYLGLNSDVHIDHLNVFVFVKPNRTSPWSVWNRVQDRTLHGPNDKIYEVRLNPNKKYEITFGDNINGSKLNQGYKVAVYYLNIDPNAATLGVKAMLDRPFIPFNSTQFFYILRDTRSVFGSYINDTQFNYLKATNNYESSNFVAEESVESIRKNAPKIFRSQNRLISLPDYENFIKSNFSNLILDCKVINNDEYLRTHLRYLNNLGLDKPHQQNQVLFNQVKFANSCNFNSIYIYAIPAHNLTYLNASQKEFILQEINKLKSTTTQVVFMDPEYISCDFYVKRPGLEPQIDDLSFSKLRIIKDPSSRRSAAAIKYDIVNLFNNFFNKSNLKLADNINPLQFSSQIINLDGVKNIQTYRSDTDYAQNEISFLVWNSKYYQNNSLVTTQTIYLDNFQYATFNNIENISERIEIIDNSNSINSTDF
jgi:hypothetical protein